MWENNKKGRVREEWERERNKEIKREKGRKKENFETEAARYNDVISAAT